MIKARKEMVGVKARSALFEEEFTNIFNEATWDKMKGKADDAEN